MDDTLFYFSLWLVLYQWLTELQDMEKRGKVICPLMVTDIAHFAPHICACDIPKNRTLFVNSARGSCHAEGKCLVREVYPSLIKTELHPKVVTFYTPVHLFDEWKPEKLYTPQSYLQRKLIALRKIITSERELWSA